MKSGQIVHHVSGEFVQVLCQFAGRVCVRFTSGACFVSKEELTPVAGQVTPARKSLFTK